MSLINSGPTTVGNLGDVNDEDIIYFDGANWSMYFDGSDVGVNGEVDAFHLLDANTILFSLAGSATLPGISGTVQDRDIVRFTATSLGSNTDGTFAMYFDGSDVALGSSSEDIDALEVLPDGRIIISTLGDFSAGGVSATRNDLVAFTPTSIGAATSGTWAMYFDGSDVGLSTSGENLDGLDITADGKIYLSTTGSFSVSGLSGADEDVFVCTPTSLGANTACAFAPALVFDGSTRGLGGDDVDGVALP